MRVLLSVYDKTGLEDFARGLVELGSRADRQRRAPRPPWQQAGIPHATVESVTGAPEMLGGRVKTLHPRLHGGILADLSKPDHLADLAAQGIEPIGLVVCNLYPFRANPSIELIDVGGPTMVRAAAKNWAHVGVGRRSRRLRRGARRAAPRRAPCPTDCAAAWPPPPSPTPPPTTPPSPTGSPSQPDDAELPATLHLSLEKAQTLRYGENPHQRGARYRETGAAQLVGRRGPARRAWSCPTSTCTTPTRPGGSSTSWPTWARPRRWSSSTPTRAGRRSPTTR